MISSYWMASPSSHINRFSLAIVWGNCERKPIQSGRRHSYESSAIRPSQRPSFRTTSPQPTSMTMTTWSNSRRFGTSFRLRTWSRTNTRFSTPTVATSATSRASSRYAMPTRSLSTTQATCRRRQLSLRRVSSTHWRTNSQASSREVGGQTLSSPVRTEVFTWVDVRFISWPFAQSKSNSCD